jgi:hypothetical protein
MPRKFSQIEYQCKRCDKPFFAPPSRKNPKYCSKACADESLKKPGTHVETNCSHCGKLFSKRADHLTANNYCSKKCTGESRKVPNAKWSSPEYIRQYMAEYHAKNKDKINKQTNAWAARNRDKRNAIQETYRTDHPDKYAAHKKINVKTRTGKMAKEPCEKCGTLKSVHAHHDDYSKPLEVRWLCSKHHVEHHKSAT